MIDLLSGIIVAGYLVCGLFFLKFWRSTADRLFLTFALAFWALAAQRLLLVQFAGQQGAEIYLYLFRLLAFSLILLAIIDKNRANASG
jgi:hypothetical protein